MPISTASAQPFSSTSGMLSKPPAAAMLPLLLIFLCGITVGALAMSFFHNTLHSPPTPADSWNKATVLKWKKELNLTSVQQRELETTLDDFSKYYDNVLADGKTRIMDILNAEQRQKFERMLLERRKP